MKLKTFFILSIIVTIFFGLDLFADNKKNVLIKKRDPFVALVDSEGKIRSVADLLKPTDEVLPIKIELKGILLDKKQPLAIINDKVFKEGNKIAEGLILEKINVDNVVLDYYGKKIMVAIRKKEKK